MDKDIEIWNVFQLFFFMNKSISFTLLMVFSIQCNSQPSLENLIQEKIQNFSGDAGVYVYHNKTGKTVSLNADEIFPTASMVKIPILVKIYDLIEHKNLSLDSSLLYYKDSINYPYKGDDAVSRFKDGEDISVSKLIAHMLTFSDNHASLWLQDLAGTGTAINQYLADLDYEHTRVNSRTAGRSTDWEKYGWGQTSPREMANLFLSIRNGEMVSARASEDMYRNLCRAYYDGEGLSQIPPEIQVASKQGAVSASKSEVMLVNAPHGDFVICIITNNQVDTRWDSDNEGYVLIRDVTRIVWNYFEPDYNWTPAEHIEEWQ